MRSALAAVAAFCLTFAVVYALGAFVAADFDLVQWSAALRGFIAFTGASLGVVAAVSTVALIAESRLGKQ